MLQFLVSTKSSRNKQVDLVTTWQIASRLQPSYYFSYLFDILHKLNWTSPTCFLFRTSTNSPWTSHYFRINHLYPLLLHLQYLEGNATLRHIQINSSHDIPHFSTLYTPNVGVLILIFHGSVPVANVKHILRKLLSMAAGE